MRPIVYLFFTIILFSNHIFAQSVTISPTGTTALIDAKSTTSGFVMPRMNLAQRAALTPTAGLQVFCNNCSPVGPYVHDGTQWKSMLNTGANAVGVTYTVGQAAQGGIVIWVDDSGQHGIVAAPQDVPIIQAGFPYGNRGIGWVSGGYNTVAPEPIFHLAMGTGIYDGEKNTDVLVNKLGWDTYAAFVARQMNFNDYGGWYLPSLAELKYMYANKSHLTGLSATVKLDAYYWSSSEASPSEALMINFVDGEITAFLKYRPYHESGAYPYYCHRVRAVRRF